MNIQHLNRTDAERVQVSVRNVDGSGSITTGMAAAFVVTAASGDGIGTVRATATMGRQFAGIAAADIAINAYGLVVACGYAASVYLSQSVGSWTITAGDTLRLNATEAGALTSVITPEAVSTQLYKYVIALGTLADTISNPRPYLSGLVRAL